MRPLIWSILFLLLTTFDCKSIDKEIQDFTNFLEKTAGPEEPFIDTRDEAENDGSDPSEDDPISDAWIYSGKFEGDLILNKRQRKIIVEDVAEGLSRNGLNDVTKRWPNNEVVYYIAKKHFDGGQIQAIEDGISDLAGASCLKFRPYQKGDPDAVVIQGARRGCFAAVGYQTGYQVLNLSARHPVGRGCFRHGTVVHELLHALGFFHMQSSPDRDDYIEIVWDNIIEGAKHNFRKYNQFSVTDFGVPYDYDSVLHYSTKAFSKNGAKTIVPKASGIRIGQRRGMSDSDVAKLNKMYCSDASDENNNTAGTESDDETTVETTTEKKKVSKRKKSAGGQPFHGSGLGYQRGQSVIIQFPEDYEYAQVNPKEQIERVKPVKNSNKKKDNKPKEKPTEKPKQDDSFFILTDFNKKNDKKPAEKPKEDDSFFILTNFNKENDRKPVEKPTEKPKDDGFFTLPDFKTHLLPDFFKSDDFEKKYESYDPHINLDHFKTSFPEFIAEKKYGEYEPDDFKYYFDDFDSEESQASHLSNAYILPSFLNFDMPVFIKDYWDKIFLK